MRWTSDGLAVGAVFGIPLLIQTSVLTLAPFVGIMAIMAGSTGELVVKLILVLVVLASVLAHELAHALTARALGVPVRHIVLTWFGGFAEFWVAPSSRWREAAIALAGPAANLAIASLAFYVLTFFPRDTGPYWQTVAGVTWISYGEHPSALERTIGSAAWLNLTLGAFNLLPGLPLDGGHATRAALTTRMSRSRAGWLVACSGVAIGVAVVAYAFWAESLWSLALGGLIVISANAERRRRRYD